MGKKKLKMVKPVFGHDHPVWEKTEKLAKDCDYPLDHNKFVFSDGLYHNGGWDPQTTVLEFAYYHIRTGQPLVAGVAIDGKEVSVKNDKRELGLLIIGKTFSITLSSDRWGEVTVLDPADKSNYCRVSRSEHSDYYYGDITWREAMPIIKSMKSLDEVMDEKYAAVNAEEITEKIAGSVSCIRTGSAMDFRINIGRGFGFLSADILFTHSIHLEYAIESISNDWRNHDRWWGSNETLKLNTKTWVERAKPEFHRNPEPHIAFPRCYCSDDAEQTIFRILNEAVLKMTENVCDSFLSEGGDYRPLFSSADVVALKEALGKRIEAYMNIRTSPEKHLIRIIVPQVRDRLNKLPKVEDNTKFLTALIAIATILKVESKAVKSARRLLRDKRQLVD